MRGLCSKKAVSAATLATMIILLISGYAPGESLTDTPRFYLSHATTAPGASGTIVFSINSNYDIGAFNLLFRHEPTACRLDGFTLSGTRSDGVPLFAADFVEALPGLVSGIVAFAVPFYVTAGDGPMARLQFSTNPSVRRGALIPLTFFDEDSSRHNELSEPDGISMYQPDVTQGSIFIPIDSLPVVYPPRAGDVNLNLVCWEVDDYMLILQRILGITSDADYPQDELQSRMSDVNRDLLPWTVADLRVYQDIILGNPMPVLDGPVRPIVHLQSDSIWYEGYDVAYIDTLDIPVYFANSLWAGAISFKLSYPSSELNFISCSTEGSRIPSSWEIHPGVRMADGFALVAIPNVLTGPDTDSISPGTGLLVTLKFAVLHPSATTFDFQFERFQTRGQANGYAVSDGTSMWSFASFQQLDSEIRFSFIRGDANGSGFIDIDDVVYLILNVFAGGPDPAVFEVGDFNSDLSIDIDDIMEMIAFIFG